MTQVELSEAAGFSQDGVSRIERGTRGCRPATARAFATALNVDVAELVAPPEVSGDPKDMTPKLLSRELERAGVDSRWSLESEETVLEEGERIGNQAVREKLIPALHAERKALRRTSENPDLPLQVREASAELTEELELRMFRLIKEARHRERTHEGRASWDSAKRSIFADVS